MNLKLLLALLTGSLFFISCSKETSFERGSSVLPQEGLLMKFTTRLTGANDSNTISFTYDAQKKVTSINSMHEGQTNNAYLDQDIIFYRNSRGLADRVVETDTTFDNDGIPQFVDVISYEMHSGTDDKYVYSIKAFSDGLGQPIRDSVTYSYSGDKIALVNVFRKDSSGYFETQRTSYDYDAKGNIITMSIQFADFYHVLEPPQLISLQYNDKLSPVDIGNDGLYGGLLLPGMNSPNCIVSLKDPSFPQSLTWSYEYNSWDKPEKAVFTDLVTLERADIYYYYN